MSQKEDFDLTQEEADRLRNALKDERFRKLLSEYVEEITDPENRRQYEEEIIQLESERGVNVKFVNPKPGFVIKTRQLPDRKKVFINISQSDAIEKAAAKPAQGKVRGEDWSIPFSLAPGREDLDKGGQRCLVYDVVYHPETLEKAEQNPRFESILIETGLDGIEKELKVMLDRKAVKKLKLKYKGLPHSTVIRKRIEDLQPPSVPLVPPLKEKGQKGPMVPPLKEKGQKGPIVPPLKGKGVHKKPENQPHYTVTHRGEFSMLDYTNTNESTLIKRPKELLVVVDLPGVLSADSIKLDVFERQLVLDCSNPDYHLELPLPYPVNEEKCVAHLDKTTSRLTLTLPVMPGIMPSLSESFPRPADLGSSSEEVPSRDDTQCGSHELPSRDDTQCGSHELPSRDDTQCGSHELPSRDDTQCGSHELPSRDDTQCGSHELPSRDDTQCGSHELPSRDDTQCGSHELPSRDDTQCGSHELPSRDDTQCGSCKGVDNTWSWVCPAYDYQQSETCVSFVLHVMGVKERSVVTHTDEHTVRTTFTSTSRLYGFSFFASFPGDCKIEPSLFKMDVSQDNVVLMLQKAADCKGLWEKMKDKLFVTNPNLLRLSDAPDPWVPSECHKGNLSCEVTSVSEKALELEVKTMLPKEQAGTKPLEPTETEPREPTETEPREPTETEPREPTETEPREPTETEPREPTETEPREPTETEPRENKYLESHGCEPSVNHLADGRREVNQAGGDTDNIKGGTQSTVWYNSMQKQSSSITPNLANHLLFELD